MDSLRWRRHRHLLALVALAGLILIVVFGDVRIAAITSSERTATDLQPIIEIPGEVDLFEDSVVHQIEVSFNPAEYRQMVATFQEEDEKAFIEATVTIDGTTIDQVGIRLKGNSTLMGLRGAGPMGDMQDRFREMFVDENGTPVPLPSCLPEGFDPFAEFAGDAGGPQATPEAAATPQGLGNPFGDISADDPASLPWLISFDEYVEGRRYQGHSEIAIRSVMTNETMLNEALALKLIDLAGEPIEKASYSSFVMNGSAPQLRLIIEPPSDAYAGANFANEGVLYKALSTGRFAYLGDDPIAYETAFDQETRRGHQDLKPVISLLRWVNGASDEEFAAELEDHVDVASLARYSAVQALLDNFDDMAGPGQNYYLWYDLETGRFTVLTWDLNLALTDFGMGRGGPGGAERPAGPAGPGRPGGAEGGVDFRKIMECLFPDDEPAGGRGSGMPRMGNPLKDRFLAAPEFQELYAREYAAVYDALFAKDQATAELDRLASVVRASGLVEAATLETEVGAIRSKLESQEALGPMPVSAPVSGRAVAASGGAAAERP